MEEYKLLYSKDYLEDLQKFQKLGKKTLLEKIGVFLSEIKIHPSTGTGKPKPLKGFGECLVYSRRINQQHRLVYEIIEEEEKKVVKILSAYGHYDDK